jgi:hypothetical protein
VVAAPLPCYSIDTSAPVDWWVRSYPPKAFKGLAPRMEQLIAEGRRRALRLICALRLDMEVEEPSLPIVLSLLDQLYETRARLARLAAAVQRQDAAVRAAIVAAALGDGPPTARA